MKAAITVVKAGFTFPERFDFRTGKHHSCNIGGFKEIFKMCFSVYQFHPCNLL